VRGLTQETILQVLTESIVDGECHDERGHSGGNSKDGNAGDHADDGLPSFCSEVAGRDEEFEAHEGSYQLSAISSARFDYNDAD
jgi:hypothetical protein